jgi:hypothetical protein
VNTNPAVRPGVTSRSFENTLASLVRAERGHRECCDADRSPAPLRFGRADDEAHMRTPCERTLDAQRARL